jgi:hypothetical protein
MDDTADRVIDRETALANFDHARDDFLQAFAAVPDEALSYLPEGGDETIGGLLAHIIRSIYMWTPAVNALDTASFGEAGLVSEPEEAGVREHDARLEQIYAGGAGRAEVMEQMEAAHDRLAGKLRQLAYEDYSRKITVYYPHSSTPPYRTPGGDHFIGWLTDHYREHIAQVDKMLGEWKQQQGKS